MSTLGTPSALSNTTISFDPLRGISTVQIYSGTLDEMLRLRNLLTSDVISILDDSQAPMWRLLVQTPDDASASSSVASVNTYELIPDRSQRDGYESTKARALGVAKLQDIRRRIEGRESGSGLQGDALKVYNLIAKGYTRFEQSSYVFRFTKVVSPRYTVKMAFSNLEKIYTTAQLKAEVNPPASILFSLDDIKADQSVGGPANIPETASEFGVIYGWLKSKPSGQVIAGNRFAITQEFIQSEASTGYYEAI